MSGPADLGGSFVALYEQLRAVARARLGGGGVGSLQATAVVHEALLRLSGKKLDDFADEQHILAAVSTAIRHVIVDHMRYHLGAGGEVALWWSDHARLLHLAGEIEPARKLANHAYLTSLESFGPDAGQSRRAKELLDRINATAP